MPRYRILERVFLLTGIIVRKVTNIIIPLFRGSRRGYSLRRQPKYRQLSRRFRRSLWQVECSSLVIQRANQYTAAAIVTGLTNYWLSFRRPPFRTSNGLANRIKTFYRTDQANDGGSYIRTNGDVRVVWNLIDGYFFNRPGPDQCDAGNYKGKRDGSPGCTLASAPTGTGTVKTDSGTTIPTSNGEPFLTSTATIPPSTSSTSKASVIALSAIASNCNCNEDGCTPESPPCCADGSCPATLPAPGATLKTCTCAYV